MLVHVNEPMRVAPGGHVIDLKVGETADGSLAEYLVATRCNVTVVEADMAEAPDRGDDEAGDGDLAASLTATAGVLHEVPPDAEPKPAPAPKTAKTTKTAAK
jgi:hypothetical protein